LVGNMYRLCTMSSFIWVVGVLKKPFQNKEEDLVTLVE